MKKLLFLALLAFIGVSCFAEVKVKRMSAPSNPRSSWSYYWNSSYFYPEPKINVANLEREEKRLKEGAILYAQGSFFYIGSQEDRTCYSVSLCVTSNYELIVISFRQGDFFEQVHYDVFYNENSAKQEYDRYCAKYKEYVRKNYVDR